MDRIWKRFPVWKRLILIGIVIGVSQYLVFSWKIPMNDRITNLQLGELNDTTRSPYFNITTQLNRLKHLDEYCRQHPELQTGINELKPRDVYFLFVDDNRKFLFCINPKVACTNWKRTFLAMSGEKMAADLDSEEVHASKDLIRLSSYPVEEIYRKLATYTKYVFVRHPYDRLLSAFRDKFEKKTSNFYSRFLSPYIIMKYRIQSRKLSQQHGRDSVTFEEFVDYVLEKKFDRHWKPFHLNCLPCRIKYDFIGKLETMDEDVRQVLTKMGVDHINFPRFNSTRGRTFDLIPSYFGALTPVQVQGLHEIYTRDFEMFGYTHPGFNVSNV